jgi:hypothetical protein
MSEGLVVGTQCECPRRFIISEPKSVIATVVLPPLVYYLWGSKYTNDHYTTSKESFVLDDYFETARLMWDLTDCGFHEYPVISLNGNFYTQTCEGYSSLYQSVFRYRDGSNGTLLSDYTDPKWQTTATGYTIPDRIVYGTHYPILLDKTLRDISISKSSEFKIIRSGMFDPVTIVGRTFAAGSIETLSNDDLATIYRGYDDEPASNGFVPFFTTGIEYLNNEYYTVGGEVDSGVSLLNFPGCVFYLDPNGTFTETFFPGGTGGVGNAFQWIAWVYQILETIPGIGNHVRIPYFLQISSDLSNNIYIAGLAKYYAPSGHLDSTGYVWVKLDSSGNLLWFKPDAVKISGIWTQTINYIPRSSIIPARDQTKLLIHSQEVGSTSPAAIVCIDTATGDINWIKDIEGLYPGYTATTGLTFSKVAIDAQYARFTCCPTEDLFYIMIADSSTHRAKVLALDFDGNISYTSSLLSYGTTSTIRPLVVDEDGNLFFAGDKIYVLDAHLNLIHEVNSNIIVGVDNETFQISKDIIDINTQTITERYIYGPDNMVKHFIFSD